MFDYSYVDQKSQKHPRNIHLLHELTPKYFKDSGFTSNKLTSKF